MKQTYGEYPDDFALDHLVCMCRRTPPADPNVKHVYGRVVHIEEEDQNGRWYKIAPWPKKGLGWVCVRRDLTLLDENDRCPLETKKYQCTTCEEIYLKPVPHHGLIVRGNPEFDPQRACANESWREA